MLLFLLGLLIGFCFTIVKRFLFKEQSVNIDEYERLKHVVPGGIYTHYCLWFTYMIAFMVIGIKFLCYSQNIFVLSFLPTLKDLYAFYPFIVSIIGDFICAFILIYNLKQRN